MDCEALVEESRSPECAEGVGDGSVDGADDAEHARWRGGDVAYAVFDVGVAATRRSVEHVLDNPVVHEDHEILSQVDLDLVARCRADSRQVSGLEGGHRRRPYLAVRWDAGDLLQREDRLFGRIAEVAVGRTYPVAELGQPLLEGRDLGARLTRDEQRTAVVRFNVEHDGRADIKGSDCIRRD